MRRYVFWAMAFLMLSGCKADVKLRETDFTHSTQQPTAVPSETDPIDEKISQMSDNALLGQMVIIGFSGTDDMDEQRIRLVKKFSVGNILLLGANTLNYSQTTALVKKIRTYNQVSIPLMFAVDFEGGKVIRFKDELPFASALSLGASGNPRQAYAQYLSMGRILSDIGIQLNLAPVLDIAKDPSAVFMSERMFGSDPDVAAAYAREAIRGLHDAGIVCSGKHFPGHGQTAQDSHKTLPVIDLPFDDMEGYALIPFQSAVDADVDAMMVAHILYPQIDSTHIASISQVFITQILREKMGFDGVVMTDDITMQGFLSYNPAGEGAVGHILAGGDIVIIAKDADMQEQVMEALRNAVLEGRISRKRLEISVRRILKMKLRYADRSSEQKNHE